MAGNHLIAAAFLSSSLFLTACGAAPAETPPAEETKPAES